MSSLYLTTEGSVVHLKGERLVIQLPPEDKDGSRPPEQEVFLRDIAQVTLCSGVHLTMPALFEFLDREIPVVFTRGGTRVVGYGIASGAGQSVRRAQYAKLADPVFRLCIASQIVQAKVRNQRRLLQRLAGRRETDIAPDLRALSASIEKARAPDSLEMLRGIEGSAAARYFEVVSRFFPETCPFERRSRQPPLNEVNALLSYGYTLLTGEFEVGLLGAGLDPTAGFYHEPDDGRPSLALDLVEPFRAAVSDSLALDLVNHQTVKPREHFHSEDGGVYLNHEGRKRYLDAFERRMNKPFVYEKAGFRTTLREEFKRMVAGIKKSVLEGNPVLDVFEMN